MADGVFAQTVEGAEAGRPYRNRGLFRFLIVIAAVYGDFGVILGSALMASWLRFGSLLSGNPIDLLAVLLFPYLLSALLLQAFHIGHLRHRATSARRAVMAFVIAVVVVVIAAFAFKVSAAYSRLETGYLVSLAVLGLILWRVALASLVNRRFAAIAAPVVIILGDHAALADERLREGAAEMIDVGERGWTPRYDDPEFLDHLSRAVSDADRVALAFGDDQVRHDWCVLARVMGLDAEVWQPDLLRTPALGLNNLNGASTLVISRGPLRLHERAVKRLFDLVLTIPGLIFIAPLMLLVAALIKFESPGPVLFVQKRIGRGNHPFWVYKFRTMRQGAESESDGQTTKQDDSRITRLGHILRATSIDELPQLFNVLKGDMSLVGPRPHAEGSTAGGDLFWNAANNYWRRHAVKPGITGLAQVRGYRGGDLTKEDLKARVVSDLEYLNRWSLFMDLRILINTLRVLLHPNAY